jgi:peptidoglycan/LPS O-acetylase OafA/YrhL
MRSLLLLAITASLLWRGYLLYQGLLWLDSFTNTLSCCDALAIGSLTALSAPMPKRSARIVGIFGIVIATGAYLVGYKPVFGLMGTVLSLSTAMIIQWARVECPIGGRITGAIARFGQLSFGLYLLHPAVLFFLMPVLSVLPFLPGFILFILGSYLVAQASFTLFETPVERSLRGMLIRKPAAPSLPAGVEADPLPVMARR